MYIHILTMNPNQATRKTLVADARAVAVSCAGMNARLAARLISRFLDGRLREAGLSVAQFGLMVHIAAAADDTIGALAERSGLDQSTLSRNLRGLEAAGLIEITVVERDQRRRAVWLTETGAQKLEAAIPAWRRAQGELSAIIDPGDVRKLAVAAARLTEQAAHSPAAT